MSHQINSANDINKFRSHAETIKREAAVVKMLQEKQDSLPSPALLMHWYKLDENHVPPIYRLQKIRYVQSLRDEKKCGNQDFLKLYSLKLSQCCLSISKIYSKRYWKLITPISPRLVIFYY